MTGMTPIEEFKVDGVRYTLTHSSRSDAAFDSLRSGIDFKERDLILDKVEHLEQRELPDSFKHSATLQLQDEYIKSNQRFWRDDELMYFARTIEGMPYLLVVASPEIDNFEHAKEVVAKMGPEQRAKVCRQAMVAGGILVEKNLDTLKSPESPQVEDQQSSTDSNSTQSSSPKD